jgi:hypothetical protein
VFFSSFFFLFEPTFYIIVLGSSCFKDRPQKSGKEKEKKGTKVEKGESSFFFLWVGELSSQNLSQQQQHRQ